MRENVLTFLPARARQIIYVLYGIVALAAASTQVGYAAIEKSQPTWLIVSLAVVGFLAVPIGTLAATHVTPAADGRTVQTSSAAGTPADDGADDNPDLDDPADTVNDGFNVAVGDGAAEEQQPAT
jgi:hypothetical protein